MSHDPPLPDRYEVCRWCAEARAEGNWPHALACTRCDGRGMRRQPSSYQCNLCTGPLTVAHDPDDTYGLREHTVSGHYSSEHLSDCTTYTFSLCEKCLRQLFNSFQVPPTLGSYLIGDGPEERYEPRAGKSYDRDREWHEYTIWHAAGGPAKKLPTGLCTLREHCPRPQVCRMFVSDHLSEDAPCQEHKKLLCAQNHYAVSLEAVAGIQLDWKTRPQHEWLKLACAYLAVRERHGQHGTWFRYMPHAVHRALGIPYDPHEQDHSKLFGMIWLPERVWHPLIPMTQELDRGREVGLIDARLPSGTVVYGLMDAVRLTAHRSEPFVLEEHHGPAIRLEDEDETEAP